MIARHERNERAPLASLELLRDARDVVDVRAQTPGRDETHERGLPAAVGAEQRVLRVVPYEAMSGWS